MRAQNLTVYVFLFFPVCMGVQIVEQSVQKRCLISCDLNFVS